MVENAAREMDCAVRTIWRDLAVLQEAGLPIYDERAPDGRRGLWRVEQSFQDRLPIPLSLAEIVALLVSRDLLAPARLGPLGLAITSALEKIRALLTPRVLAVVEQMGEAVGARALAPKLQPAATDYLPEIQKALLDRHAVQVRYYSMSRGEETARRIDPYHLTYFNGGLYLLGYCHLRQAVRIFAVERMRALETLSDTYTIPADFDIEEYLRGAWGMIRGDLVTVQAVFSKAVAPYVRERLWHPSQEMHELPGGRLALTLRVADTVEVRRWVLGFGSDAEVILPAELREALRQEAVKVAAALAPRRKPAARAGAAPRRRRRQAIA